MAPAPRTLHQRDRRFARVRSLVRGTFLTSGAVSAVLTGYFASLPHVTTTVVTKTPATTTSTSTTTTTTTRASSGHTSATTNTTTYTPPTTVPVTTTTTCYSTPSGNTMCN